MAPWLTVLTAFTKSVPSTHRVLHSPQRSDTVICLLTSEWHQVQAYTSAMSSDSTHTHTHTHTHTPLGTNTLFPPSVPDDITKDVITWTLRSPPPPGNNTVPAHTVQTSGGPGSHGPTASAPSNEPPCSHRPSCSKGHEQ